MAMTRPKLPGTPRPPPPPKAPIDTECITAHPHASRHRVELAGSTACGCFFCFRTFGFGDIARWIDSDQTALCPRCGIDAVLGSSSGFLITDTFLRRMHRHWFNAHGARPR